MGMLWAPSVVLCRLELERRRKYAHASRGRGTRRPDEGLCFTGNLTVAINLASWQACRITGLLFLPFAPTSGDEPQGGHDYE